MALLVAQLSVKMGRFIHEIEALPLDEFMRYVALNQVDPWTEYRGDLRSGLLSLVVNRSAGGKGELKHFMPNFKPERRERDPEQLAMILKQWVGMHNARVKAREKLEHGG